MAGWIVSHNINVYYLFELPQPRKRLSPFLAPVAASHGTVEGSTALPNETAWSSCQRFALMAASHVHSEAGRAGQLLPTSFYGTLNRSAKLQVFWRRINLPVLFCHGQRATQNKAPPPCARQFSITQSIARGEWLALEKMENEADVERIRLLLTEERKLWSRPSTELVSDRVEEMCCGWKPVRSSATYNLRKPATNKRRKAASATLNAASVTLSVNPKYDKSLEKRSYMSGELDENYFYVYRGGLSSRVTHEAGAVYTGSILDFHFSSPPRRHVQTVTLEPSAAHEASVHALAHCRDELSRILALQLKPELLVEQLIIENRLRTMSLAAFPVLEAGGSSPSPKQSGRAYSQSTPSLGTLPNTHVDYRRHKHKRASRHRTAAARRKAKESHLQWCESLSSHRNHMIRPDGVQTHWPLPEVSHRPSALHRRRSQPSHNSKPTSHLTATFTNDTTNEPSTPYRLPMVSPTLAASEVSNSQTKTSTPRHTLLYKPDGSSKHHKSSSLAKSSSFYYPSISYSNSKHTKHNLK